MEHDHGVLRNISPFVTAQMYCFIKEHIIRPLYLEKNLKVLKLTDFITRKTINSLGCVTLMVIVNR